MPVQFTVTAAGYPLVCDVICLGADVALAIQGGNAPHIGCTVLAIPRPSLTGHGRSATVSTLNRTGHKDDILAVPIAKTVATELDCVVSCTCGFHVDQASPQLIEQITQVADQIAQRTCALLHGADPCPDPASAPSRLS